MPLRLAKLGTSLSASSEELHDYITTQLTGSPVSTPRSEAKPEFHSVLQDLSSSWKKNPLTREVVENSWRILREAGGFKKHKLKFESLQLCTLSQNPLAHTGPTRTGYRLLFKVKERHYEFFWVEDQLYASFAHEWEILCSRYPELISGKLHLKDAFLQQHEDGWLWHLKILRDAEDGTEALHHYWIDLNTLRGASWVEPPPLPPFNYPHSDLLGAEMKVAPEAIRELVHDYLPRAQKEAERLFRGYYHEPPRALECWSFGYSETLQRTLYHICVATDLFCPSSGDQKTSMRELSFVFDPRGKQHSISPDATFGWGAVAYRQWVQRKYGVGLEAEVPLSLGEVRLIRQPDWSRCLNREETCFSTRPVFLQRVRAEGFPPADVLVDLEGNRVHAQRSREGE